MPARLRVRRGGAVVVEDAKSFGEYASVRTPTLLRFAYLLSGNREFAEDLVQDTLVKVYRRWPRVVKTERPDAYVRRMLVNEYLSWRRRRSGHERPGPVPDRGVPDAAQELVDRDMVWRLLDQLPRRQRAVLVLRYYEHASDEQVAEVLGCPRSTVRSLASRAFATLRRHPDLTAYATTATTEEK